jgi:hypothetical protein
MVISWLECCRPKLMAATEGTRGSGGKGTPCQQRRRRPRLRGTMHSALREHQHRLNTEVPHSHHCVGESRPALPWDRCGLAPPCRARRRGRGQGGHPKESAGGIPSAPGAKKPCCDTQGRVSQWKIVTFGTTSSAYRSRSSARATVIARKPPTVPGRLADEATAPSARETMLYLAMR